MKIAFSDSPDGGAAWQVACLLRNRSDCRKNFRVAHPSLFEGCGVVAFRMSKKAQSRRKLSKVGKYAVIL
jgi:hypothetical protein